MDAQEHPPYPSSTAFLKNLDGGPVPIIRVGRIPQFTVQGTETRPIPNGRTSGRKSELLQQVTNIATFRS
jgi:hypothetical protein